MMRVRFLNFGDDIHDQSESFDSGISKSRLSSILNYAIAFD